MNRSTVTTTGQAYSSVQTSWSGMETQQRNTPPAKSFEIPGAQAGLDIYTKLAFIMSPHSI